jgi:DNA repair protein RecN (Recombination protein N)
VDTGVSGRAAQKVAEKMARISRRKQVLCVTHLPQVAAQADWQWQVSKATRNGVTLSAIQPLDEEGRVQEVARMLGGVEITDITRQHASELLRKPA